MVCAAGLSVLRFGTPAEFARVAGYALFRRAAGAALVGDLATHLLIVNGQDGRTYPVVVLGDLNDEPAAATSQILYGPPGSQPDNPLHPPRSRRPVPAVGSG